GQTPGGDAADMRPELQARLARGRACLQLLHEVRPRPPSADTTIEFSDEATTPLRGDPPLQSQFGRFQIRRELGRGGFGVVFLAHDPRLGRDIALKVPHAEALVTEDLRARFQQEARAAATLDHPSIVSVYEAGEVGPVCYIASAYCPGLTLSAWLKQ